LVVIPITEGAVKGSGLQLRTAGGDDVDAAFGLFAQVQSIHADAEPEFFRPPENDETFKLYFEGILRDPDQHLVFACVDGMEVGYIEYFQGVCPKDIFRPERRLAYIHSLVVTKEHRRAGCASVLIEHVKQEAGRQDISLMGIDVWSFNDAARACFEKAGFKTSKEFMWLEL
jgi:ribosomal protein S18 acetylase RimI-like enzyme